MFSTDAKMTCNRWAYIPMQRITVVVGEYFEELHSALHRHQNLALTVTKRGLRQRDTYAPFSLRMLSSSPTFSVNGNEGLAIVVDTALIGCKARSMLACWTWVFDQLKSPLLQRKGY